MSEPECKHENAEYIRSDESGITANLVLEMYWCPDCGRYILKHVVSQENFIKDEDDYTLVD